MDKLPAIVALPATSKVPPTVEFPEALKVVNAPVDAAVSYTHLTLPTTPYV